MCHFVT
jgi:hypothetical protein